MFDIAIIGGGVIGALIARELSAFDLNICVVEKDCDVAMGASSANSGIVHAGYDAAAGTLKAKFNLSGNGMMPQVCRELEVGYRNNGSLVLGYNDKDREHLAGLMERGRTNGVKGLKLLDRDALVAREPNVSAKAQYALLAESAGIVCPYTLNIAAMGNAMDNGVQLFTHFAVMAISKTKTGYTLTSDKGSIECSTVINCAGLHADFIAGLIGDHSFKISARKGEYILLDREAEWLVSSTLFSCPDEKGKGVLVTPTVDGTVLLGPTSKETDDKEDKSTSIEGIGEIVSKAGKLCDKIPFQSVITSFAGMRAYSDRHDFIIERSKVSERFIHVAGIESPGLTSAPSIARYVAEMALSDFRAKRKESFDPYRESDRHFSRLIVDEKNKIIMADPDFGKIICRCEGVTLGEIKYTMTRNPMPTTVSGIKRRVRAGMGRCQGGFCQPPIVEVMREMLGVDYDKIYRSGDGSYIFTGKTK